MTSAPPAQGDGSDLHARARAYGIQPQYDLVGGAVHDLSLIHI